jgi:16S rRNA (cytosine967-C5)-methyltransferase
MKVKLNLSDDPRRVAYEVLCSAQRGELPEKALEKLGGLLSPKDLALATALVYETFRHLSRLDFIIKGKLKRGRASSQVQIVLRLGVVQLLILDRMAVFAAVAQTVELAKAVIPGRDKLVNAVLRSLVREKEDNSYWPVEMDGRKTPPAKRLSVLYSHPLWLTERLVSELGFREARSLLVVNNRAVEPTIRINPLKTDRDSLAALWPCPADNTALSPWGLVFTQGLGLVDNWPGYHQGLFSVQDEASQLLGLMLGNPKTILDCCAGVGGKTLLMAALLPQASILAVDKNSLRLACLTKEAQRLGLEKPPVTLTADFLSQDLGQGPFELVLVDAPCSGLGVIRRRPDLKWNKKQDDPARFSDLQLEFLNKAADYTAPGGRLIYSVCTITNEESLGVAERFLARRTEFRSLDDSKMPQALKNLAVKQGQLKLWPHKHHTDGYFYALMEKVN